MKTIVLFLVTWIALINFTYSQTDCLKYDLVRFLKETKDLPTSIDSSEISNSILILNVNNPQIKFANKPGIYKFGSLSTHSYFHLLVAGEDDYEIINMNKSLDKVILEVLEFYNKCDSNNSVEDLSLSLKNIIALYNQNLNAIPWENFK